MNTLSERRKAGLGAVTVVLLLMVAAGAFYARRGSADSVLQGVPDEDFENAGVFLSPAPAGESAAVTAEAAVVTATEGRPDARVRETVLVRLVNKGSEPPVDTLAWAVNFEPKTVAVLPLGPQPGADGGPRSFADINTRYAVAFVDANTGALIFRVVAASDGSASPQTLPR